MWGQIQFKFKNYLSLVFQVLCWPSFNLFYIHSAWFLLLLPFYKVGIWVLKMKYSTNNMMLIYFPPFHLACIILCKRKEGHRKPNIQSLGATTPKKLGNMANALSCYLISCQYICFFYILNQIHFIEYLTWERGILVFDRNLSSLKHLIGQYP